MMTHPSHRIGQDGIIVFGHERFERSEQFDPRQPKSTGLHRCFPHNPRVTLAMFSRPRIVPPHHRTFGGYRYDPVDPKLGQLLNDQIGAISLNWRKGYGDGNGAPSDRTDRSVCFQINPEPDSSPSTLSVTDGKRITGTKPQRSIEVMPVGVIQHRGVEIFDECQWAMSKLGEAGIHL